MTYQRFEDLPVWQEAAKLFDLSDDFLRKSIDRLRPSFRFQLERAVLSVSNNIAEGFERHTTRELLQFLYIARGSAGEVRSMLCLLVRRPWMDDLKSEIHQLITTAESCSRQLGGWSESLRNSCATPQRFQKEMRGRGTTDDHNANLANPLGQSDRLSK